MSDITNYARISAALVEVCRDALWEILVSEVPAKDLPKKIRASSNVQLSAEQKSKLCPTSGSIPSASDADISALYTLIRNLCDPRYRPSNGWGKTPGKNDTQVGDDVERIRQMRNVLQGYPSKYALSSQLFKQYWAELSSIVTRLDAVFGKRFKDDVDVWETKCMDEALTNYARISAALVEVCRDALWEVLVSEVPAKDLPKKIRASSNVQLSAEQKSKLCPTSGSIPSASDADISALYTLIRNLCDPRYRPSNGWGKTPGKNDTQVGDDVERIRQMRNVLQGHPSKYALSSQLFKQYWAELSSIVTRLDAVFGKRFKDDVDVWETKCMDEALTNYARISAALVEVCRDALWEVLVSEVPAKDLPKKIRASSNVQLSAEQKSKLCPTSGSIPSASDADISALYTLIRNLCDPRYRPSNGWDKTPGKNDTQVGDDVERIRQMRNVLRGHPSKYALFKQHWAELTSIVTRLDAAFGKRFKDDLDVWETKCMDQDLRKLYEQRIQALEDNYEEIKESVKQTLSDGTEKNYDTILMVVGEDNVGKSSLTKQLLGLQVTCQYQSTDGIDIYMHRARIQLETGNWETVEGDKTKELCVERAVRAYNTSSKSAMADSKEAGSSMYDKRRRELNHLGSSMYDKSRRELNHLDRKNESFEKSFERQQLDQMCQRSANADKGDTSNDPQQPYQEELNGQVSLSESEESNNQNEAWEKIIETVTKKTSDPFFSQRTQYASISVYDFAGQHIYYSSHMTFLSPRGMYLLVQDINRVWAKFGSILESDLTDYTPETYNEMFQSLDFWLNIIYLLAAAQSKVNKSTVAAQSDVEPQKALLVLTHVDLLSPRLKDRIVTNYNKALRFYLADTSSPLLSILYTDVFAVNCLEKNDEQVEKLKQQIYTLAKMQPMWGEETPRKWIPVEFNLQEIRRLKVISVQEIEQLVRGLNITMTPNEQEEMLKAFHQKGDIIYNSNSEWRNFVVLDCFWLVGGMRAVITAQDKPEKYGPDIIEDWKEFKKSAVIKKSTMEYLLEQDEDKSLFKHKSLLIDLLKNYYLVAQPSQVENEEQSEILLVPAILEGAAIDNSLKTRPKNSTPVLSFVSKEIKFMPPAAYHKLIAACVGTFKWTISKKDRVRQIFKRSCRFNVDKSKTHKLTVYHEGAGIQIYISRIGDPKPEGALVENVRSRVTEQLVRVLEEMGMGGKSMLRELMQCPKEDVISFNDTENCFRIDHLDEASKTGGQVSCDNEHTFHARELLDIWYPEKTKQSVIAADKTQITENQGSTAELAALKTEITQLKNKQYSELVALKTASTEVIYLRSKLDSTVTQITEIEKKQNSTASELTAVKTNLTSKHEFIFDEVTEMKEKQDSTASELTRVKNELTSKQNILSNEVTDIKKNQTALSSKVDTLKSKQDTSQAAIADLTSKQAEMSTTVINIQARARRQEGQLKNVVTALSLKLQEIETTGSEAVKEEQLNLLRFHKAVCTTCREVLRDVMLKHIRHADADFYSDVSANTAGLSKSALPQATKDLLLKTQPLGVLAIISNFDITCLYAVTRNISSVKAELEVTKGSKVLPKYATPPCDSPRDDCIGANVERIKNLRNYLMHSSITEIPTATFETHWRALEDIVKDLEAHGCIDGPKYRTQLQAQKDEYKADEKKEEYAKELKELLTKMKKETSELSTEASS